MKKQIILIVDDSPENIAMLSTILGKNYEVKVALNGHKALEIARTQNDQPDLILLDIMMPEFNGYEVCQTLKGDPTTYKIPVIFISALGQSSDESKGFDVGGVDYITKPIVAATVCARVKTHLALYDQNRMLEEKVRERTQELTLTQDVTIVGFATLAEYRNEETGAHIMATQQYITTLARYLAPHPRFSSLLNEESIELLSKSAPLHDIGKIAVPDRILMKPARLTQEEFEEMKKHTIYGYEALSKAEQALGKTRSSFLQIAKEMAYTHHEKWDGSGYPQGLSGNEIPLAGRLMALADVYDALTSKRIYKEAFSYEKAGQLITAEKGKHFDPDIVDAFVDLEKIFENISKSLHHHEHFTEN
jgi:putative two-component system response regulator